MMKQKQKTLGERLFDPRWLSNQGDARRDVIEPPVGLDLARALAARHLDTCDLGEAETAAVEAALSRQDQDELQGFLDGVRPEPPASLIAPANPTASTRFRSGRDASLRGRCGEVLALIGWNARWVAAAGLLLLMLGGLVAAWFSGVRPAASPVDVGSEVRPAWASMVAAAEPAAQLARWGSEEPARSLTWLLRPLGSSMRSRSSGYIDPRVVAVAREDGSFQSGTVIGPRLVLTLAEGLPRKTTVFRRDGRDADWAERSGEIRTRLPALGLATLIVDDDFETWFDVVSDAVAEAELVVQMDADGLPIERTVGAYGFGGAEGGILWSASGHVLKGDLVFTDVRIRRGLGGGPIAFLDEGKLVLVGIVVGSHSDGRFAAAVSAEALRQWLFSQADLPRNGAASGEG